MQANEQRDTSGQVKDALIHDVRTGTLKRIKLDQNGDNFRKVVPSTRELDKKPRKFPRE